MQEVTAAAKLLEPLCHQNGGSSYALLSAVARIYLQGGNIPLAARHFAEVEVDPNAPLGLKTMNAALLAAAEGDWAEATDRFRMVLQEDAANYVVRAQCTKFRVPFLCSATSIFTY